MGDLHLHLLPPTCPWGGSSYCLSDSVVHRSYGSVTQSQESGGCGVGCSILSCCLVPTFIPHSGPLKPPWDCPLALALFILPFVLLLSSTWFCQDLSPGRGMTKHPWFPLSCGTHPSRPYPRRSSCHGPWGSRFSSSLVSPPPWNPCRHGPISLSSLPSPFRLPGLFLSSYVCWVTYRQRRWADVPASPGWWPPQLLGQACGPSSSIASCAPCSELESVLLLLLGSGPLGGLSCSSRCPLLCLFGKHSPSLPQPSSPLAASLEQLGFLFYTHGSLCELCSSPEEFSLFLPTVHRHIPLTEFIMRLAFTLLWSFF